MTRRPQWTVLGLVGLLSTITVSTHAAVIDSVPHPPPTSGTYAYNTFKPGAAAFPGLGGTYVYPVFGETVRRVTDVGLTANDDDIYAHHWCNANGTSCFTTNGGGLDIYSPVTGAVQFTNQPVGHGDLPRANVQWHPTDPTRYQRFETNKIVERHLPTQTEVTIFTAPANFDNFGGSLPWVDGSGDIYVFSWNGRGHIWKRSTNTLYAGETVNFTTNGGWISITPDGNYIVTAAGGTAPPQKEHWSYAINHATASVATTPVQFWGLCGDHGVIASASDGHSYFITYDCQNNPGIWRADVALNQAGKTEDQQLAANKRLVPLAWENNDGHLTGNMSGALKDWVFLDTENLNGDPFNGGVTGWTAWKQEIIAMNIVTGEVRRLAHHRSRGLSGSYYAQPHISSSWDGSIIIWQSNMGVSSPKDYVDTYSIGFNPAGSPTGPPPGPPVDTTPPNAPTGLSIVN